MILQVAYKLLGACTLPDDTVKCTAGDHWVPILNSEVPLYQREEDGRAFFFPYNYAGIEQNSWGIWRRNDTYLRVYESLESTTETGT